MLSPTAQHAIEAYGGISTWKKAKSIEAIVSAKGLAFTLKRRPVFEKAIISMKTDQPVSRILSIGKNKGIYGVLDHSDVHLEDEKGNTIEERKNARSFFPFGRRLFY